jgi:hypothetical protein
MQQQQNNMLQQQQQNPQLQQQNQQQQFNFNDPSQQSVGSSAVSKTRSATTTAVAQRPTEVSPCRLEGNRRTGYSRCRRSLLSSAQARHGYYIGGSRAVQTSSSSLPRSTNAPPRAKTTKPKPQDQGRQ